MSKRRNDSAACYRGVIKETKYATSICLSEYWLKNNDISFTSFLPLQHNGEFYHDGYFTKKCPGCFNNYSTTARVPRTLPCDHTICHECLEQLLSQGGGKLKCPICSKEHLPDNGAGSFPVNGGQGGDNDAKKGADKNATAKSKFCRFLIQCWQLASHCT